MTAKPLVLLIQLPIPTPGYAPVEGNVPLAAASLKLFARRKGLEQSFDIELLPAAEADRLGDQALVEAILARRPAIVGFACYMWNVERSLWIADRLKRRQPELRVIVGGPEITADNAWVLDNPALGGAVVGEGEATFAEWLAAVAAVPSNIPAIPGLWRRGLPAPPLRRPLANLDALSSPYLEGILELGDARRMLLETVRGCRFHCKYCYYPKGNIAPRSLSAEQISANLRYAVEHGATEVVLLDPTLNQRPDFEDFVRLLQQENAERRLTFSGELRAEGIDAAAARLLADAGFHEVEIGLQSVEPKAWKLMGRPTDLAAFERGAKALRAEGIKVQADLIVGLPGDTVDSVRRGIDYLVRTQAYSQAQLFNLSILPGTAFRRDAERLGLTFQPWPPYYVLKTPTLDVEQMFALMEEAQEAFGVEFDPMPPPRLTFADDESVRRVDLDSTALKADDARRPTRAFTLWLRSADFRDHCAEAAAQIERLLADNPHTTLEVVLEPTGEPERLTVETLRTLLAACYRTTTYLDRYYSLHPGKLLGSKRLVVAISREQWNRAERAWQSAVADYATLAVAASGQSCGPCKQPRLNRIR